MVEQILKGVVRWDQPTVGLAEQLQPSLPDLIPCEHGESPDLGDLQLVPILVGDRYREHAITATGGVIVKALAQALENPHQSL